MGKIKVLNISDLENNQSKVVNVEEKSIAVFNVDGEFFAIDDKCSHADESYLREKYTTVKLNVQLMELNLT